MLDLYLIATPLFSVFIILTLLILKLSLKKMNLSCQSALPNKTNKTANPQQINQKTDSPPNFFTSTYCFTIRNLTIAQIFITRRAKNKIPIMLSLSIIALCCFIVDSFWMFAIVGSVVTISFLILHSLLTDTDKLEHDDTHAIVNDEIPMILNMVKVKTEVQSYSINNSLNGIYSGSGIVSIGLFTFIGVWFFKDYRNDILLRFLINFAINASIDFVAVQPVVYLLLSLPLGKIQAVQKYIRHEQKINLLLSLGTEEVNMITIEGAVFNGATGQSPRKKRLSPSKVPRALDLNLFQDAKVRANQKSKIQSRLTDQIEKQNKQDQNFSIALEMSKRIKKQRKQLPPLLTPISKKIDSEEAFVEAFNNTNEQLKVQTPIAQLRHHEEEVMEANSKLELEYTKIKTEEADRRSRKRPTRGKPSKNATISNDSRDDSIFVRSPTIKSPHIRSPYEVQFQEYLHQQRQREGVVPRQEQLVFKNRTEQENNQKSQLDELEQEFELKVSTETVRLNKRKKIEQLSIVNRERINRFTLQNNTSPIERSHHLVSKNNPDPSQDKTFNDSVHNQSRKVKIAHNNFHEGGDDAQYVQDQTPSRFLRKNTASDISGIEAQELNKINIGRNTTHLNNLRLDDQRAFQDSQQETENGFSGTLSNKRKKDNMNASFELQRQRSGYKKSLLQIREEFHGQIEQLDANSPERRRRRKFEGATPNRDIQGCSSKKRKSNRKYSTGKKRVIKFTSGQPYLEYLPNMLSKQFEKNHKNSQHQINRKDDVLVNQSKRKSVRRFKNTKDPVVRQYDENECPQFTVEEL